MDESQSCCTLEELFLAQKILSAGIVAVLSLPALLSVGQISKMERVFDDLLPGGAADLPGITKLVLGSGGAVPILAILLPVGVIFALMRSRKPVSAAVLAVVGVVVALGLAVFVQLAIYLPMVQIITSLI